MTAGDSGAGYSAMQSLLISAYCLFFRTAAVTSTTVPPLLLMALQDAASGLTSGWQPYLRADSVRGAT